TRPAPIQARGEFPRYFLVLSGLSYGTRIPSRAMHKLGSGPRSQPVALIRVAWLIPVVSFLRSIGAPVEQLLARAHLSGSMFDDPEDLLSVSQALGFMEESARMSGVGNLRSEERRVGKAGRDRK